MYLVPKTILYFSKIKFPFITQLFYGITMFNLIQCHNKFLRSNPNVPSSTSVNRLCVVQVICIYYHAVEMSGWFWRYQISLWTRHAGKGNTFPIEMVIVTWKKEFTHRKCTQTPKPMVFNEKNTVPLEMLQKFIWSVACPDDLQIASGILWEGI